MKMDTDEWEQDIRVIKETKNEIREFIENAVTKAYTLDPPCNGHL